MPNTELRKQVEGLLAQKMPKHEIAKKLNISWRCVHYYSTLNKYNKIKFMKPEDITPEHVKTICRMRRIGYGYQRISDRMKIRVNVIKKYCRNIIKGKNRTNFNNYRNDPWLISIRNWIKKHPKQTSYFIKLYKDKDRIYDEIKSIIKSRGLSNPDLRNYVVDEEGKISKKYYRWKENMKWARTRRKDDY